MKTYSAIVRDGKRVVIIENQEYQTKAEFIHDLRNNGYKVNPAKVKTSGVFTHIITRTNCAPWDWRINSLPVE